MEMKRFVKSCTFLVLFSTQLNAVENDRSYPDIDPKTLKNQCPKELNLLLKQVGLGLSSDSLRVGVEHEVGLVKQGETSHSSWPAARVDRFFDPIKKLGVNVVVFYEKDKRVSTSSISIVNGDPIKHPYAKTPLEAELQLIYPQQFIIELNPDCSAQWLTSVNNVKDAEGYTRPNVYFHAELCKNLSRLIDDPENKGVLMVKDIGWIRKKDLKEAESMCKQAEVTLKK